MKKIVDVEIIEEETIDFKWVTIPGKCPINVGTGGAPDISVKKFPHERYEGTPLNPGSRDLLDQMRSIEKLLPKLSDSYQKNIEAKNNTAAKYDLEMINGERKKHTKILERWDERYKNAHGRDFEY